MREQKVPRVLAISSGGGHWLELMRLREAFVGCEVIYATTIADYCESVPQAEFHCVLDVSRWDRLKLPLALLRTWALIRRVRPDVVISTGALPGLLAIICGRINGARTIWVDSFANFGELSLCGRLARRFSTLWLTQWEHLARPEGPRFLGRVI